MQELARSVLSKLVQATDFKPFVTHALEWIRCVVGGTEEDSSPLSGLADDEAVWRELYRDILRGLGPSPSLESFLQELDLRSKEPSPSPDAVTLMTIHSAKGKEFDHVYLMGMVEDMIPSFQSKKKGPDSSEMEEERRNCFVAITRTQKTLTLTYAGSYRG